MLKRLQPALHVLWWPCPAERWTGACVSRWGALFPTLVCSAGLQSFSACTIQFRVPRPGSTFCPFWPCPNHPPFAALCPPSSRLFRSLSVSPLPFFRACCRDPLPLHAVHTVQHRHPPAGQPAARSAHTQMAHSIAGHRQASLAESRPQSVRTTADAMRAQQPPQGPVMAAAHGPAHPSWGPPG